MGLFSGIFSKHTDAVANVVVAIQNSSNNVISTIPENKNLYTFDFTYNKFRQIIKNKQDKEWFDIIYSTFPKYQINTPKRVAGFLAQIGHESSDFNTLEENLNYSASGLVKTFPKSSNSALIIRMEAKGP